MRRGFTVLELVLVMGIMAILLGGIIAIGSMLQNSTSTRGHKNISALVTEASVRARNSIDNSDWGVYFTTNATTHAVTSMTLFSGTTYATRDTSEDIVTKIDSAVIMTFALTNISPYVGSGKEIVFEQGTGDPHEIGDVTLVTGPKTSIITVTSAGFILYAR